MVNNRPYIAVSNKDQDRTFFIPNTINSQQDLLQFGYKEFIVYNGNSETDAKIFNIGLNAASELYIKLDGQDDTLGGGNPPSILIDAAGTVHINGTAQPLDSTYGFVYE